MYTLYRIGATVQSVRGEYYNDHGLRTRKNLRARLTGVCGGRERRVRAKRARYIMGSSPSSSPSLAETVVGRAEVEASSSCRRDDARRWWVWLFSGVDSGHGRRLAHDHGSGAKIPGGMRAKAVTRVTSSTCPPPTAAPPCRAVLPNLRDPSSPRGHAGDIHSPRSTREGLVSHRKVLPLLYLSLTRPLRKTNP